MEIDARTIREVEFREKIRGYNPDDVDDFLEQVALAFESIEDRLRTTPAQAEANRTAILPQIETKDIRSGSSITSAPLERTKDPVFQEFADDTIQRTLLLAQKTADMTVSRAEEQAEITVQEAKAKAEVLENQAQLRAREIVDEAVNHARDEVLDLAKSKDRLLGELNQLTSKVVSVKSQVKQLLEVVLQQVDESFAPVVPKGMPVSNQSGDSDFSQSGSLEEGSNNSLFNDASSANGSGVFDDELE